MQIIPPLTEREAALRFLLDRIDYERMRTMPYDSSHLGLDRMRCLLGRLGHPEVGLPVVHVAGTKGKGSTAAMVAAMLTEAGYRTGLFTSPHLERLEERIRINGCPCLPEELVEAIRRVRPAVEAMDAAEGAGSPSDNSSVKSGIANPPSPIPNPFSPTYFEITTAMALLHFRRAGANVAVLEVGLGGRLDATNVCTPLVSIITSISFDHTQQLGNTLAAIAGEKAGIVKPGVPVVSGAPADEPREVIRDICRQRGSRLVELGLDFDFDYRPPRHLDRADSPGLFEFRHTPRPSPDRDSTRSVDSRGLICALSLPGRHQAANAAVALAAIAELRQTGWRLPEESLRRALKELTWPARVEVAARRPAVVLDSAHNPASIEALVRTLDESFSVARRLLIFATTQDKDLRGMLALLLGKFDEVVFTRYLDNPRAVPPEELAALAAELTGRHWPVHAKPADAWEAIRRSAAADDLVCVTGSFFIAAEMRRQLESRPLSNARQESNP